MGRAIAIMVGIVLVGHAVLGLFVEGHHFLIFNVDIVLDLMYLACGLVLLFVGAVGVNGWLARPAMLGVAGLLAVVGLLALLDNRLFGIAPTGLTPMDLLLLFGLAGAVVIGALQPRITERVDEGDPQQAPPVMS